MMRGDRPGVVQRDVAGGRGKGPQMARTADLLRERDEWLIYITVGGVGQRHQLPPLPLKVGSVLEVEIIARTSGAERHAAIGRQRDTRSPRSICDPVRSGMRWAVTCIWLELLWCPHSATIHSMLASSYQHQASPNSHSLHESHLKPLPDPHPIPHQAGRHER